jgi:hypothetical protein
VSETTTVNRIPHKTPGEILGIDGYTHDGSTVVEVYMHVITDGGYTTEVLNEETKAEGVGQADNWECVGVCTTEWDEAENGPSFRPEQSRRSDVVYVAPDRSAWTTHSITRENRQ